MHMESTMTKKLTAIIMCGLLIVSVASCGYKDYSVAKKEFAQTESIRMKEQTIIVMETLKILMGGFEQASQANYKPSPMFEKTYTDANGKEVTETVYSSTGEVFAFMAEYRKPDIVRELVPMIKEIYTQQQLDMVAPVTSGEVAIAFVKTIPFMATVAGMYGLGVSGIENAGSTINATVSNGSSFANDGGIASSDFDVTNSGEGSLSMDNNFTDDNSINDNRVDYGNTEVVE